jgi:hypothetical protein
MKASSPMSFMKARQHQTLKRTSSCPDVHQIDEIVKAKNNKSEETQSTSGADMKVIAEDDDDADNAGDNVEDSNEVTLLHDDKAANVSVQTEEFLVSPYEHLFPFVLPQWLGSSSSEKTVSKQERTRNS